MTTEPQPPQGAARTHLKRACAHTEGTLTGRVSPRLLGQLHQGGYIAPIAPERPSPDEPEAISSWRITSAGRLAVLTSAQCAALTGRVNPQGRFDTRVAWATLRALVEDRLAEYRDEHGTVQVNDGDDGVRGPKFSAYRTDLGRELADLALKVSAPS